MNAQEGKSAEYVNSIKRYNFVKLLVGIKYISLNKHRYFTVSANP